MARATGKKISTKSEAIASATPNTPIPSDNIGEWTPPVFAGEAKADFYEGGIQGLPANDTPKRLFGGAFFDRLALRSFLNIRAAPNPFYEGRAYFEVRDAILLCQKAYWNFPLLKNTIDVMTELSNSRVYLEGGNQKTRDFIGAWWDRIGFRTFKEEFFREFWRSGTVPIYRFDGEYDPKDITQMTQVFGSMKSLKVPVRYIILNPASIQVEANISFLRPMYYKVLSNYELARIRNPKTPEDKQVLDSLLPENRKQVLEGVTPSLLLDPDRLTMVFYKKRAYEPMAVPFAYPLLEDIDAKMELKRIDRKVARQADRMLLLITAGAKPDDGGINYKTIQSLQTLFANESVNRTLVADYTVKAEWQIPDINKVLGPQKYEQLDKDISAGLNAILFSDKEKFASTSIKVQIFVERLKEARASFLENFLQPEIKRICKTLNAKNYPVARFEEINLRDDLQFSRLYTQLAQLGLLTPGELFEALDTGKIPIAEQSLIDQQEYKTHRENGLYLPLVGASVQDPGIDGATIPAQLGIKPPFGGKPTAGKKGSGSKAPTGAGGGRPTGSTAPQTIKKASPIGTPSKTLSTAKLKDVSIAADTLILSLEKKLKRKHKLKALSNEQQEMASLIAQSIMANEEISKWETSIASYIEEPKAIDPKIEVEIDNLSLIHDVDPFLASILRLSKSDEDSPAEE